LKGEVIHRAKVSGPGAGASLLWAAPGYRRPADPREGAGLLLGGPDAGHEVTHVAGGEIDDVLGNSCRLSRHGWSSLKPAGPAPRASGRGAGHRPKDVGTLLRPVARGRGVGLRPAAASLPAGPVVGLAVVVLGLDGQAAAVRTRSSAG